nr:hypothetical protein [uncultured Draconibacterium sp.]
MDGTKLISLKSIQRGISLIPALTIFLIFFAALKNYFYYTHFGLNIFDFWSLQEIIISFLDEIVFIIIMILAISTILPTRIPSPLKLLYEFRNEKKIIDIKPKNPVENQKAVVEITKIYRIIGLLTFSLIFIFSLFQFFTKKTNEYQLWLSILATSTLIAGTIVLSSQIIKAKDFFPLIIYFPVLLTIALFGFSLILASFDITSVKFNGKYAGTVIEFKDRTIVSDAHCYYIGKTKDYIFMHDEREKKNIIYKTDDIKKITYPLKNEVETEKDDLKGFNIIMTNIFSC